MDFNKLLLFLDNLTQESYETNVDSNWFSHSSQSFKKVCYSSLSYNLNINDNIIMQYIDKPWDWKILSQNPCITSDLVKFYPDKPWDWINLSSFLKMDIDFFKANWDKWKYSCLSHNPNITMEIIQSLPKRSWNWNSLSSNPNITMIIVNDYPELPWNYVYLSLNPNLTWDFIQKNLDKDWNWKYITSNKNITMDIINANPDKPWDWDYLNQPKKTWDYIRKNPDKDWKWGTTGGNGIGLSERRDFDWKIVEEFYDKPWDSHYLSLNPYITMDIFENNKLKNSLGWSSHGLARNPNITWDIIQNSNILKGCKDFIFWSILCTNEFLKHPIALKNHNKKMSEYRSINRILKADNRLYNHNISIIMIYFKK
jgi:hypothetical protein